jgi:hypothetical protein
LVVVVVVVVQEVVMVVEEVEEVLKVEVFGRTSSVTLLQPRPGVLQRQCVCADARDVT